MFNWKTFLDPYNRDITESKMDSFLLSVFRQFWVWARQAGFEFMLEDRAGGDVDVACTSHRPTGSGGPRQARTAECNQHFPQHCSAI